ncbi:MAG: alpha/beta hydrolase [Acetobacterales bacterium]
MRRGYADTPHGQIHYAEAGDGPPLVLLHPTPRSGRAFAPLQALLSDRFRTVALDTLGFGSSDPLPADPSMPLLADSVARAMDALHIARAHVLGMHTGNKIAAALAAGRPERVDRLVLLGMTHSLVVEREQREAAIHGLVHRYFDTSEREEGTVRLLASWHRRWQELAALWWDMDVLGEPALDRAALAHLAERAMEAIACGDSVETIYRANFAFDLAECLGRIVAPTLVVELATEAEAALGRAGEAMAAAIPDGCAVRLDGADRTALARAPERIAEPVAAFLGKA